MVNRFLFKDEGSNDQVMLNALRHAINIAKQGANKDIHITYPSKSSFESSNFSRIIDKCFGVGSTKKLCKGESISIEHEGNLIASLSFILPSKINSHNSSGTILAIHCTSNDMNKIDSNASSADTIIFLSWLLNEANNWENIWHNNSLTIMHGEASTLIEPLQEEVIQELTRLTKIINLSTGLAHPSDKEHAKRIFMGLKKKGYRVDVQAILNWAIANGWNERHLKGLKKLAQEYLS